jgi:quercetin dioxygenase-like cupin family protein
MITTPNTTPSTHTPALAQDAQREVVSLGAGEGEHVWFLDNLLTIKVRGDAGAPFSLAENAMPVGSHTPFHRHDDEDEAFYVLEGTLKVHLGEGRAVQIGPGGYLHLPKGTPHGFVEMIREAGEPAARHELPPVAPPDKERLEAACAAHAITLLGPLPE